MLSSRVASVDPGVNQPSLPFQSFSCSGPCRTGSAGGPEPLEQGGGLGKLRNQSPGEGSVGRGRARQKEEHVYKLPVTECGPF